MCIEALDEVGLKPDGTLKEGMEAQTGIISGKGFQNGVLRLLKQAMTLLMCVFDKQLKRAQGVSSVQMEPETGTLSFTMNFMQEILQITIEDKISQLDQD